VKQANKNAGDAKLKNYHAMALEDRFTTPELLAEADVLVVDPPRAGLHPKLIAAILETPPKRIVYLSCNPVTQARDIASLQNAYKLTDYKAYDFYPQTTHLEGLAVLDQLS
jgi:23S rRNA (uracil1939-C5)-methyltransferase